MIFHEKCVERYLILQFMQSKSISQKSVMGENMLCKRNKVKD